MGQHIESRVTGYWPEYIFIFNFYKQWTRGNHTYILKRKTEVSCGLWRGEAGA